ncbi:hypothetical protein QNJ95_44225 [Bradyrhizobium elkanii]|uniref:hypothetical protein n=1 Tax=Bradyrhizobium elkanii TaxID=29448 RepID=UPI00271220B5|nr:hypothetical protein [Bradyrhizobium elkanii]WLA39763.1 hypothetical protein QNJ95_44225 [Bradyrhizobium elkanii]
MVALEADAAGKIKGSVAWEGDIKDRAIDRFERSHFQQELSKALTGFIQSTR